MGAGGVEGVAVFAVSEKVGGVLRELGEVWLGRPTGGTIGCDTGSTGLISAEKAGVGVGGVDTPATADGVVLAFFIDLHTKSQAIEEAREISMQVFGRSCQEEKTRSGVIPGRFFPPRNSSAAPPAADTKVNLFSRLK